MVERRNEGMMNEYAHLNDYLETLKAEQRSLRHELCNSPAEKDEYGIATDEWYAKMNKLDTRNRAVYAEIRRIERMMEVQ